MNTRTLMMTAGLLGATLAVGFGLQSSQRGASALPGSFVSEVTNPFFPLDPGTIFHYVGRKSGVDTRSDFEVTHSTRMILGVACTVVRDQAFEADVLVEDTLDYFAQDAKGNVWYFGEDSRQLDANGNVISTEGSWIAGRNGASPGIVMEANPRVGDFYAQEDAPGVAEDRARVMSLDESVTVPFGSFDHVLKTQEFSKLDPGILEEKYYAAGVGNLLVVGVKGEDERSELVSITKGD